MESGCLRRFFGVTDPRPAPQSRKGRCSPFSRLPEAIKIKRPDCPEGDPSPSIDRWQGPVPRRRHRGRSPVGQGGAAFLPWSAPRRGREALPRGRVADPAVPSVSGPRGGQDQDVRLSVCSLLGALSTVFFHLQVVHPCAASAAPSVFSLLAIGQLVWGRGSRLDRGNPAGVPRPQAASAIEQKRLFNRFLVSCYQLKIKGMLKATT